MRIKNTIIATIAALLLTACGDFLEPKSESEFVPEDAISLNELLLGEAYQRNDKPGFSRFLALLDDDIEATPYQNPNVGFDENKYLASFSWQPDMFTMMELANSGHTNIYEYYYRTILGANAVIDYIPLVKDTENNIRTVKAQAYALRGFYYFNLVNIFGQPYNSNPEALGVPLKTHSGIEKEEDALRRRTVAEVYTQILSDLHEAESNYLQLPYSEQWSDDFRTSLPMVQLMLSRTYLYMENWAKAAEYAEYVMNDERFKLLDLNTVPYEQSDSEGNTVRNYVVYPTYSSSETIWPYGDLEDMFEWTYSEGNNTHPTTGESIYSYFQASESLLASYLEWDLRLQYYIIEAPVDKTWSATLFMPYGKINVGTDLFTPKRGTGIFGRCLRLSEAYLNYAEAKAMMGGEEDIAQATTALNTLLMHRFDPQDFEEESFDSQEELIEFVRGERRRELCFEGHRWFDLRRWGMPSITHKWHVDENTTNVYTLEEGDLLYTIPIPKEAMEENPSLIQNELPGKRTPSETIQD